MAPVSLSQFPNFPNKFSFLTSPTAFITVSHEKNTKEFLQITKGENKRNKDHVTDAGSTTLAGMSAFIIRQNQE